MPAPSTTRYVAVYEGEGPGTSRPVIATSDPATVAAITRIIVDRVNAGQDLHPPQNEKREGAD